MPTRRYAVIKIIEGEAGNGLVYKPQEMRGVQGHWD